MSNRVWDKANPEKRAAQQLRWCEKNREKTREYAREWRRSKKKWLDEYKEKKGCGNCGECRTRTCYLPTPL